MEDLEPGHERHSQCDASYAKTEVRCAEGRSGTHPVWDRDDGMEQPVTRRAHKFCNRLVRQGAFCLTRASVQRRLLRFDIVYALEDIDLAYKGKEVNILGVVL